eukprot:13915-Heterococcus_DN1.PRE.2
MAEQLRSNNSEFSINTGNRARLDLTALQARAATWNLEETEGPEAGTRRDFILVILHSVTIRSALTTAATVTAACSVISICCNSANTDLLGINLWQRAVTDA